MSENPRQELADLFSDVRGGGSFSTRRTARTGDLLLKVRDVGPLRIPVTARQAKELQLVVLQSKCVGGDLVVSHRGETAT